MSYFTFPTVRNQQWAFVSEGHVWLSHQGHTTFVYGTEEGDEAQALAWSQQGTSLAFTVRSAGEWFIHVWHAGHTKKICQGYAQARVIGWRGNEVLFSSPQEDPFGLPRIFGVHADTCSVQAYPYMLTSWIDWRDSDEAACVIQRHGYGYGSWHDYQGGTRGEVWIRHNTTFELLRPHTHNMIRPVWCGSRILFLSDPEGRGNVYSCDIQGQDLQQHTHHAYTVHHLSKEDEDHVVYSVAGQVYRWCVSQGVETACHISAPHVGTYSKTVTEDVTLACITDLSVHDQGKDIAVAARGQIMTLAPWAQGPQRHYGTASTARYTKIQWLSDGRHVGVVAHEEGEEILEILNAFTPYTLENRRCFPALSAKVDEMKACPHTQGLVLTTGDQKLWYACGETLTMRCLDTAEYGDIEGFDISADGRWVVYSFPLSWKTSVLRMYDLHNHTLHTLTTGTLRDVYPSFDPQGKYVYFLSNRTFQARWDDLKFGLYFAQSYRPYAVALQAVDMPPWVQPLVGEDSGPEEDISSKNTKDTAMKKDDSLKNKEASSSEDTTEDPEDVAPLFITWEGIDQRLYAFPLPQKHYAKVLGLKEGRVLLEVHQDGKGELWVYHMQGLKKEVIALDIQGSVILSLNRQWMVYGSGDRGRLLPAGEKGDDQDTSFKQGGWICLDKVLSRSVPAAQWSQMFQEAWALQKTFFWNPKAVDWPKLRGKYQPLIDRANHPSQVHHIISEMQGELKTSHAYVSPKIAPSTQGYLPLKGSWCKDRGAYVIEDVYTSFDQTPDCAWTQGMVLTAVDGRIMKQEHDMTTYLAHKAQDMITVSLVTSAGETKQCLVQALSYKEVQNLWYCHAIKAQRRYVQDRTQQRVGYIHIPNMDRWGFEEFYRHYLQDYDKDALIIDLRFNGGGCVSPLILDMLRRRRDGYDISPYTPPLPLPLEASKGILVFLCNEYTGSDGDIFTHAAKNLGPVIGKRTWGGVVGISPKYTLWDGTRTMQPQYAYVLHQKTDNDLENYGVDPTHDVDLTPNDLYNDPQMDYGISIVKSLLNHENIGAD